MAFAQFYYDPALEFEKLLDDRDDGTGTAEPPVAVGAISGEEGAAVDVVRPTLAKSESTGAITRSTSMAPDMPPSQAEARGSRWFGGGFLRRCASTGSINGGPTHPGIPK